MHDNNNVTIAKLVGFKVPVFAPRNTYDHSGSIKSMSLIFVVVFFQLLMSMLRERNVLDVC